MQYIAGQNPAIAVLYCIVFGIFQTRLASILIGSKLRHSLDHDGASFSRPESVFIPEFAYLKSSTPLKTAGSCTPPCRISVQAHPVSAEFADFSNEGHGAAQRSMGPPIYDVLPGQSHVVHPSD